MEDIDKFIKALEDADVTDGVIKMSNQFRDVLVALLKEQEAIQVPEDKINKCECGETVCRYWHPKFCGFCGRNLLWY